MKSLVTYLFPVFFKERELEKNEADEVYHMIFE